MSVLPFVSSGFPIFNRHLAIVLPSQSIATEKDHSQPVTKRQLSFVDLLSHLKHHNSGTRKGSLFFFFLNHPISWTKKKYRRDSWSTGTFRVALGFITAISYQSRQYVGADYCRWGMCLPHFWFTATYRQNRMHPSANVYSHFCPGYYQEFHQYASYDPPIQYIGEIKHLAIGRSHSAFLVVAFIRHLCTNPHFPRDQDWCRALLGYFPRMHPRSSDCRMVWEPSWPW